MAEISTDPSQIPDPGPPVEAAPPPAEAPKVETPAPSTPPAEPPVEKPAAADPVIPAGEKKITDPSRLFGQKPAETPPETPEADEEIVIPEDTPTRKEPPHVRKLAKALDDKKRVVKTLETQVAAMNTELEALRKQPRTPENAAEIADLVAERKVAKAAQAEAEQLRNELAETKKNLAMTDVRLSSGFLKEQEKLHGSVARANTVLEMVKKDYGTDVKIKALVEEWRSENPEKPLYNSIISALRDAGNPAAEEVLKLQLRAIEKSQDVMYNIEQSGLKQKEEWEGNRKSALAQTIEATKKAISTEYPLYDRSSQAWMALPPETKAAIAELENKAAQAAEIAVNTKDPHKLADMAFRSQLALEVANAGHANAVAELERVNAEIVELKGKLAGYERSFQGSAGGLNRSAPTTGGAPPRIITDPSKIRNFS